MANTNNNHGENLDIAGVDLEHLARQALTLFSRRYNIYYDNVEFMDADKKGFVTKDELIDFQVKEYSPMSTVEKAREMAELSWFMGTGGHPEITQINRKLLVDLCIKGYHSQDESRIKLLRDAITSTNRFHFDMMDTNKDGFITSEEFASWARKMGDNEKWPNAFAEMDLNGDGLIDRDEFLRCGLGFFFYIDEDRYNHHYGVMDDSTMLVLDKDINPYKN